MSISLVIKCGENTAKFLIKPKITFGRSKSAVDISVDDKKISSKHLEITHEKKNEIIVKDLNSTNGTFINNKKIEGSHRLYVYETVRIGNCYITICLDDLTELELKSLTRPIEEHFENGEVTQTNTNLADQTSFLAINNKLSLQSPKLRGDIKKKAQTKKPAKKKKPKEPEEDKTVMTKIMKFFK
ncbi:FHA domain-containing protein [Halobacteriovorax sp. DPLXC-1]|uniref:FHA domain-containing protein n=1 Tax=unclassified Halobacteriovorax TaxID=2639665 RepID=UPI002FF1F0B3